MPLSVPAHLPRPVQMIGAASALGAPHPGSAQAPDALQAGTLLHTLATAGIKATWQTTLHPSALACAQNNMNERLQATAAFARQLADHLASLPAGTFPLILGGDHAIATGTWRGLGRRLGHAPGLIWIDAHLDSHTAHTTHSGNIHGMPLAALLGEGDAALTALPGPTLDPRRTCIIGARAWEPEELALLQRLGVRVFAMTEVCRRGLAAVFADALQLARANGQGFGVSLDLDALDPLALPAVTCPEAAGIAPDELVTALRTLAHCPDFIAFEIVEYRPDLDPDGRSADWLAAFALAALAPASAPGVAKVQ